MSMDLAGFVDEISNQSLDPKAWDGKRVEFMLRADDTFLNYDKDLTLYNNQSALYAHENHTYTLKRLGPPEEHDWMILARDGGGSHFDSRSRTLVFTGRSLLTKTLCLQVLYTMRMETLLSGQRGRVT